MKINPTNSKSKFPTFMVYFALVYGVIALFCIIALDNGPNEILIILMMAICISTPFLTAMWSVWGSGSYFKRLLYSHLVATIVGMGIFVGVCVNSDWNNTSSDFLRSVSFLPLISLGAQLPFWFFRGCFGWQLVKEGSEPQPAFKISDLFVVMFVFAIAISLLQIALNYEPFITHDFSNEIQSGEMTVEEVRTFQREQKVRNQQMSATAIGSSAVFSFVFSLIGFPLVLFGFRTKDNERGCLFSIFYACTLFGVIMAIAVIVSGGSAGIGEPLGYLMGSFAITGSAISIPIAVARADGYQFVSLRKFRKQNPIASSEPVKKEADIDQPKKHALDD